MKTISLKDFIMTMFAQNLYEDVYTLSVVRECLTHATRRSRLYKLELKFPNVSESILQRTFINDRDLFVSTLFPVTVELRDPLITEQYLQKYPKDVELSPYERRRFYAVIDQSLEDIPWWV